MGVTVITVHNSLLKIIKVSASAFKAVGSLTYGFDGYFRRRRWSDDDDDDDRVIRLFCRPG